MSGDRASTRRARVRAAVTARCWNIFAARPSPPAPRCERSTIVRRIVWRRGAVSVDAAGPKSRADTLRGRAAVVTVSAGVLRHAGDDAAIAFEPSLPADKREALSSIEMGHAVKVVLWFRTAFWEGICDGRYRDASLFRRDGGPFPAYWTQFPVRSTLVAAWAGGPRAVALDRTARAKLIERARNGFAALLKERS